MHNVAARPNRSLSDLGAHLHISLCALGFHHLLAHRANPARYACLRPVHYISPSTPNSMRSGTEDEHGHGRDAVSVVPTHTRVPRSRNTLRTLAGIDRLCADVLEARRVAANLSPPTSCVPPVPTRSPTACVRCAPTDISIACASLRSLLAILLRRVSPAYAVSRFVHCGRERRHSGLVNLSSRFLIPPPLARHLYPSLSMPLSH
ncbi:hypothetical protein B0H13DRAFT_2578125 [Mycena leptocephala]|nr:hypothetical protein B0H13DRAFT_2578125 [Mycena leptocephala]